MRYFLLVFIFFTQVAQAADITAQVDRNTVHLNESFQLVFEASGSIDEDPDFSALEKDFDIVSRSQSSNISIINGNYKKTTKWSLILMPKQAGVMTIPSIPFGKDQSPQLRITIKPASAPGTGKGDDLYLEVETATKQAYVQGQLIITVKMLSANNISRYGLNDLEHEGIDVVVEQLGDDKQYRAYRGSKPYLVLERTYALFPQEAGSLRIKPFRGEVEVGAASGNFYDPFRRRSQIKRVRSRALEIDIKGIPKQFTGRSWLPASELQLVEEWPDAKDGKPEFKVGEPVTRTLSILADGLTSAQLPELTQAAIAGIKQYPDQPSLHDNKKSDGIIGIREERIALIPTRAGSYTLPAIEIPWWNVNTGKMETARIASRQIQVAVGSNPVGPDSTTRRAVTQPIAPVAGSDQTPVTSAPPAGSETNSIPWNLVSLGLAAGWLLTVAGWWWSQRRRRPAIAPKAGHAQPNLAKAMKTLRQACGSNNAADCQRALIDWGRHYYAMPTISNPGEIGKRAGEPLQSAIHQLEAALYSTSPGDWSGANIAAICQQMTQQVKAQPANPPQELEPLYK